MKFLLLTLTLILPGLASAYTGLAWGAHSQVLASVTISNSGSVSSVTSSSASTGGNSVGGSSSGSSAGSVTTGEASASASSQVTSGSDGTSVRTETTTTVNGETKTEVVEKMLGAGETVDVQIEAQANSSTSSGGAQGKTNKIDAISVKQKAVEGTTTAATSTPDEQEQSSDNIEPTASGPTAMSIVTSVVLTLADTVRSVLSWLSFW